MWSISRLACVVVVVVASSAAAAVGQEDPFEGLQPEHPRLFLRKADLPALRELVKNDAEVKGWYADVRRRAEGMLKEPPVRHELVGPRLLTQSRTALERMWALGGVYLIEGDKRFAERAVVELKAAAAFPDWNPSHFLDVGEMTTAFAFGYDWFYDHLSPEDRTLVREAIVRHGLRPGLKAFETKAFWTRATHNWAQVCNGGLTIGTLAIADEEPEICKQVVALTRKGFLPAMHAYAPDGGFPEGPGYWKYATDYTVYYLAALESALGADWDVKESPGFDRAGMFRIHATGPTGLSFNYADAGEKAGSAPIMFWLAHAFGTAAYADHERAMMARGHFLHVLWAKPKPYTLAGKSGGAKRVAELPLDAFFEGVDVATFRSAWNDGNALYVGAKGGNNRFNHSHLDLGSFVLDAQGERWALDLGPDDYNLPGFFGKQRWTYFRLRTESHNVVTLGTENQDPAAKAEIVKFLSTPGRAHAVIDLSKAYGKGVKSYRRGLAVIDRSAVYVQDEIELAEAVPVRWNFHTAAKLEASGRTATLTQGGKTLRLRIISPESAAFAVIDANPLKPQRQRPEVMNVTIPIAAGAAHRIEVMITRGDEEVRVAPQPPLAEWPTGK
jgi:hypothetical protein